jgi:cytochrome c55X
MIAWLGFAARFALLLVSGFTVLSVASLMALAAASAGADTGLSDERQAELRNLLTHDCGSCHGLTMAGGLGPSLRREALAGKPSEYVAATILYGRPGTAMPPWRPFLSAREAAWLADLLLRKEP